MSSHGRCDDCDITFKITMIIKQGRFKSIECMNTGDVMDANAMKFILLNVYSWFVFNLYLTFSLVLVHF
jgi:hypothetical protein